jgi:transcription antitermination factor NusG
MESKISFSALKWYAIRVASNFENVVTLGFSGKGIESFLPLYTQRKDWNSQRRQIEMPLFPGYVFARFDIHSRLPVLKTPGVVHIVGAGRIPVPVEDSELEAVRALLQSRVAVEPCPFLNVGDRIRIERGPLRGLEGFVVQLKGTYRLVASVTRSLCNAAATLGGGRNRARVHLTCCFRTARESAAGFSRDLKLEKAADFRRGP